MSATREASLSAKRRMRHKNVGVKSNETLQSQFAQVHARLVWLETSLSNFTWQWPPSSSSGQCPSRPPQPSLLGSLGRSARPAQRPVWSWLGRLRSSTKAVVSSVGCHQCCHTRQASSHKVFWRKEGESCVSRCPQHLCFRH